MFDNQRVLEDLKALDIIQIASDIGRQVNRQNLIHCTFHDEKTPSMKLYQKQGRFKCFGCGKTGSTIDLYASAGNGMEFCEAVKEMKNRYLGLVDRQTQTNTNQPRRLARPVIAKAEPVITPAESFSPMYTELQRFCRQYPPTDLKRQASAYLLSRAFTIETIKHFGLFVIPDLKATSEFLTSTYEPEQLEASGLFSPKGFMFYRHPIIIPYLSAGQIVNLQARCIDVAPKGQSKYQYLRSRPITTMFNIDAVKNLAASSKVYLTEGAFDAMAVYQKGGTAVSINSVSGFKPEWVKLFKKLSVCFLLDSDEAGQTAIQKLAPLFRSERIPVSMKSLPANCKDVNEWLVKWAGHLNGYPAFWDQ